MPAGQVFEIADLMAQQSEREGFWYEFLRSSKLYCGLYVLPAGTKDPQQPHADDEVYYVVKGSGVIQVNGEDMPLQEGSVVFVAADADHHFHTITEDLTLLVFFEASGSSVG